MIALVVLAAVLLLVAGVLLLGKRPAERGVARHVEAALSTPRDDSATTADHRSIG